MQGPWRSNGHHDYGVDAGVGAVHSTGTRVSNSLKIFLGNQIVLQAPLTKTFFVAAKALKGLPHILKLQII